MPEWGIFREEVPAFSPQHVNRTPNKYFIGIASGGEGVEEEETTVGGCTSAVITQTESAVPESNSIIHV